MAYPANVDHRTKIRIGAQALGQFGLADEGCWALERECSSGSGNFSFHVGNFTLAARLLRQHGSLQIHLADGERALWQLGVYKMTGPASRNLQREFHG